MSWRAYQTAPVAKKKQAIKKIAAGRNQTDRRNPARRAPMEPNPHVVGLGPLAPAAEA
jgi:hypothetical protein